MPLAKARDCCARPASGPLRSGTDKASARLDCFEEIGIGSSQRGGHAVTKGRTAVVQQCVLVWGSRTRVYAQRRTTVAYPDALWRARLILGEARCSTGLRRMVSVSWLIARQPAKMPSPRVGKQAKEGFTCGDAGYLWRAYGAMPLSCIASRIRGQSSRAPQFPFDVSPTAVGTGQRSSTTIAAAPPFPGLPPSQPGVPYWPVFSPARRCRRAISERAIMTPEGLRSAFVRRAASRYPRGWMMPVAGNRTESGGISVGY